MDLRAILMGVAFAVMWSSAFTSARIIVEYAPPLMALALRFALSGAIGVGLALWLGQSWRLGRRQWIGVAVFGVCQNALYLGLNFVAMQTVEASVAVIIASALPLLVALFGWVFQGQKVRPLGLMGLLVGMIGVGMIMGTRLQAGTDLFGVVLCVLGLVSLAVATLSVASASSGGNVLMSVGLQMLVGSAFLWPAAFVFETWEVTWSWPLVIAFAYTTIVPGLLATLVWFLLVRRIGTVKAATFHFLNPFLGVAIAAVLLGEALSSKDIFGVAVIAAGILAVQVSKQRTTPLSEGTRNENL